MKYLIVLFSLIGLVLHYTLYPEAKIPDGAIVDRIVVVKSKRELVAYAGDRILIRYRVALGKQPAGAKRCEGDNKTPEGVYRIFDKTNQSRFHKNLGISYPKPDDLSNALKQGIKAGCDIKIHGLQSRLGFPGRLHSWRDWTGGCIALTNAQIDDLYSHTPIGTIIEIRP